MIQSGYPNLSFPPRYAIVCATPATHTHRDPGGKPSGARVYYPPLRFQQSHNQYGPTPALWAMQLQLVPTQGCQ